MPWYLHLAFKQLWPRNLAALALYLISILGIGLGTATLLVTNSIMGGFGDQIRQKIVETSGHILIQSPGILYFWESIVDELRSRPEVRAAEALAQGPVMLTANNRPAFPVVRSMDPWADPQEQVVPYERYMLEGTSTGMDEDSVLLSAPIAGSLGVRVGSRVNVYTPLMLERLRDDEVLLPRELRVAGIFETGWYVVDERTIVLSRSMMQDLYGLGDGVHSIAVRLTPGAAERVDAIAASLNEDEALLPMPLSARTWKQIFSNYLWVLDLERNVFFFLMIIISVVAAFTIACALIVNTIRKTREIGLLVAMGGTRSEVVLLYVCQALLLGLAGLVGGLSAGAVILHFRNDIIHWISGLTGTQEILLEYYQFAQLPANVTAGDLTAIVAITLALSMLAAALPALIAASLRPAEALRNE